MQALLRSYRQLYTLKRVPSFVPYFVWTSSIMRLTIWASAQPSSPEVQQPPEPTSSTRAATTAMDMDVINAINQGIANLAEMGTCRFAEQGLGSLRYLTRRWNIDVDIEHDAGGIGDTPKGQAEGGGVDFFAPSNYWHRSFTYLWNKTASSTATGAKSNTGSGAARVDNLLFWPLPMQGRLAALGAWGMAEGVEFALLYGEWQIEVGL